MAAPSAAAATATAAGIGGGGGGFEPWLAARLEALGLDRAVYGAYIAGLLREEEGDEERLEALRGVLAACLEEDLLNDVCREVVEKWSESQIVDAKEKKEDEIQAIASMMEKQAKIVVKPKEISQEDKQRKAALLAQYANVTDEEDGDDEQDGSVGTAVNIGSEKCILCFSMTWAFWKEGSICSPWVRNEQLRFVLGESRLSLLRQNSALLPARQGSCKVQPSARSRRAQDLGAKQNGADAAAAFFCATGCAVTADTPWP
nr:coiled-coil domain-containing protein 43 isoform X1 [Anas platyrhynchos]